MRRSVAAGNKEFAGAVTRWLMHARGVLRFGEFVHRHPGSVQQVSCFVTGQKLFRCS